MAKYQEWLKNEKLILLQGWARDGLNDKQIAHNMGVSYSTFNDWKKRFSEFSEALSKGKEVVDYEVENAMFKTAIGHTAEECTYERQFNRKTGQYEMVMTKKVVKYFKPEVPAQIMWLKNRKGDVWRDKQPNEGNSEALDLMYKNLDFTEGVAHEAVNNAE